MTVNRKVDKPRTGGSQTPVGSLFGRIVAAVVTLAVVGAALALGLLFAAFLLGGLLLAGLWYSLRGRTRNGGETPERRRPESAVIDGEYTVLTDSAKDEHDQP